MTDPAPEFIPVTLDVGALQEFRRPFEPAAVKFKIQSAWKDNAGAMLVAYIDARVVVERLNHVTALWQDEYRIVAPNTLECTLTVCGVTRRDVGVGQGQSDGDRMKGAYSDALKRAAVKFGIGVSIYALQVPSLKVGSGPDQLRAGRDGRPKVDDRTMAYLREQYGRWLKTDRGRHFGEPLGHGDEPDAQGDPDTDIPSEVPAGPSAAPERPPMGPAVSAAVEDLRAEYSRASAHWASLADSEKNELAERVGYPMPMVAEYNRLAREAVAGSSEDDIGPLVELTARLERLR